jgi:hypothetical protein
MNPQKIELEKLNLISWIIDLQDFNLIEKLKEFKQSNETPQWQIKEVHKRTKEYNENPSILLNIEDLDKDIKLQK